MPNTKISALTAGNPALGTDQLPISRSGVNFQVTAASIAALSPAGTVTSVGASGGTTGLTFSGQPITTAGTLTLSGTLAPANGGTGALAVPTNGQLLIGNGTNYSVANLTAGSNITITNSAGGISIAAASGVTTFSAGTTGLLPSTATPGAVTLTGTLALANGGTGQTTKAAAFNALSPVTSTGDLIIGNGANSNTRLAIGTTGYVLTSNGTTASWQPAAGGGGGVTSFDGGFTGLGPYSPTTGAVSLSGTLNASYGGTGTGTTPSNGQLLIGNGGGYSVANLTAGTGVTITNGSGSITIAASGGGGGPTIDVLNVSTMSSGTFFNNTPSSTYSKPLIGSATSPSNYGAFFFKNTSSAYNVSSATLSSIGIMDSTPAFTSYTSGTDFNSFPNTFYVSDDTVACYGLMIYSAGMQTLFASSKTAQTSPNLAPYNASSGYSSSNPSISVSTTGSTYDNSGGRLGVVVSKSMTNYILAFGSGDFTSASPTVNSIQFTVNMSSSTYFAGSDFTVSFANNSSTGGFAMLMSVSNPTLQTLLNNSFL